jgi:tRNA(Ile)-lysidine synthase
VSGGADSLCLAWLLRSWGDPVALIIDHGLRASSKAEAALTAERLQSFGVPAEIITLTGVGPTAAEARASRYAALLGAMGRWGLSDLLLGHHVADQAETVLMRRRAASGAAGLAGMAAITHVRQVRLVRPLLGVDPARLRATLCAAGLAWVEDPSNRNPAYLRSRLRLEIGRSGGMPELVSAAAAAAASRAVADREAAAALGASVEIHPAGYAVWRPGALPPAALAALIRCLSGRAFSPGTNAVARIAANPAPCVLAGVRLLPAGKKGRGMLLVREAAAMAPPVAAAPGAAWDGRFTLHVPDGQTVAGLVFGAVGPSAAALRGATDLPDAVLRTLPALWRNGVLAAVPHIGYRASGACDGLEASFTPAHPLAGAPFLAL